METIPRGELLATFFELQKLKFAKCLGDPHCTEPAIRAHSVQNSRALDLLAVEGHVFAPTVAVNTDTGPYVRFERVGRNKATTFTGLCARHDAELFRQVDTEPLDAASDTHRSLLAWRAGFFESHATSAVALQMQAAYQKRVERGQDPRNLPSPAGFVAVGRMLEAWKVFRWRAELDIAFHSGQPLGLSHESLVLDVAEPTLAVSGLFSVGTRKNPNDLQCVALNVLPLSENKTWALFSFKPADGRAVNKILRRVLSVPAHDVKYQLSRLVVQRCQNFVLSPRFFETWSEARCRTVLDFFERTLMSAEVGFDSPDLQLLR